MKYIVPFSSSMLLDGCCVLGFNVSGIAPLALEADRLPFAGNGMADIAEHVQQSLWPHAPLQPCVAHQRAGENGKTETVLVFSLSFTSTPAETYEDAFWQF